MKTFGISKDNLDDENCKMYSNRSQVRRGEDSRHNLLSFSNVSFHKLFENELAGVEDKTNNKGPPTSKYFEQINSNEPEKNVLKNNVICDNFGQYWTSSKENRDLQAYKSNKENNFGEVVSALSPTSIKLLSNTPYSFDSLPSYHNNALSLSINLASEKHSFNFNNSKTNTIQLSHHHCLPLYNLGDSFINSYKKLSVFNTFENSRNIDQYVFHPQLNEYTSLKSKIAFGELIEGLLKISCHIDKDLLGEQQFYNQLSLGLQNMVNITEEGLQNSLLDSSAKYTLDRSAENVSSSTTNTLLVYPDLYIDMMKEKEISSIKPKNYLRVQLLERNNEQVINTRIIDSNYLNNTKFLQIQQNTMPNNLEFGSKHNIVKDSILVQNNVSKHLTVNLNEGYNQKIFCDATTTFSLKQLFNNKINWSVGETSCTMNLCNQLRETPPNKQSAANPQAVMNCKLLWNDTMINNSPTRKRSANARYAEVNKTIISTLQNETNQLFINSYNTQFQNCKVTTDTSKNCQTVSGNVFDQTFVIKSDGEIKSRTLTKHITKRFPKRVADVGCDCTIKSCNQSLENQTVVQYPSLPENANNLLQSELLYSSINSFNFEPFLKDMDKSSDSFVQSKISEFILCNLLTGKTSINIKKRPASDQQLFNSLANTIESDPCKQLVHKCTRNAHFSQLPDGESKHLSSKKLSKEPLLCTEEPSQEISTVNGSSRKGLLPCFKGKKCDMIDTNELPGVFKSNKLFQIGLPAMSSASDSCINSTNTSNQILLHNTIQFGKTSDTGDFYLDIDKAIDESINKYENFMCDKGVLVTPDTSDKSCQTDAVSKERLISCKRCLQFDGDLKSKKIKVYHKSKIGSNARSLAQVGTSSIDELMSNGSERYSSSNPTCINKSQKFKTFNTDLINTNDNVMQTEHTNSSLTVNNDMNHNVNIDTMFCDNSYENNAFSLYDDYMDIEDRFHWFKDYKEFYEGESRLSDHEVPVVEEVSRAELIKSLSSFKTPKKPILKVGLSRSARLKPLHQKKNLGGY